MGLKSRATMAGALLLIACTSEVTLQRKPAADPVVLNCQVVRGLCLVQASYSYSTVTTPALWLAVDTGSSFSVLDSARAAELGLHSNRSCQPAGPGSGGDNSCQLMDDTEIRAGAIDLKAQTIVIVPFTYVAKRVGHLTDGTLGSNLFLNRVIEIDYEHAKVRVADPENWRPDGGAEILPLELIGNVPFVTAKIGLTNGMEVEGKFLIDTGQILSGIFLTEEFVKAHPDMALGRVTLQPPNVIGVGGALAYSIRRLEHLRIGSVALHGVIASFPKNAAGVYAMPGLAGGIGADVLSRFNVTFDYTRRQMTLKPTTDFNRPFLHDLSGLVLEVRPPDFGRNVVTAVMVNSPAGRAQIQVDDQIVAINGKNANGMSLTEVRAELMQANVNCRLTIQRGRRKRTVHLLLKNNL